MRSSSASFLLARERRSFGSGALFRGTTGLVQKEPTTLEANEDPDEDDTPLYTPPAVVRVCLMCGHRARPKRCPRCGAQTFVEVD
jgi:hypothetical protein